MIGLVLSFAAQQLVVVHWEKPYDAYLALSGYGMKSRHFWQFCWQCQQPMHYLAIGFAAVSW